MDCHPRRAPLPHGAGRSSPQDPPSLAAVGLVVAMLAGHCRAHAVETTGSATSAPQKSFKSFRTDCHDDETATAGLSLESLALDHENPAWICIHDRINSGEMPPADSPQSTPEERGAAVAGLANKLTAAAVARQKTKGRVVLRRMNRREYEHTLHDMLGLAEPPAALLPEDSFVHGFDTTSGGLETSATHLLRYRAAASTTMRRVIAADDSKRTLASIGPDGRVEWSLPCGPIHDLHLLPDGHILYQDGWTRIVELDALRQPVWVYDATRNGNAGRAVEVHAFQRLADGATMIVESGPARIIEVDRDGTLRREVTLTVNERSVHSDTRNARKTGAGTYLVAHEKDGIIREYDATGKVVWEFDVPLFGKPRKSGHGPESFGDQAYSAVRLADGNTLIGTGNGHSVLEVNPAKEIVWKIEQKDLPGIVLAWVTQVSRLKNGNTLFVNCHAGPGQPQIIEVTPTKQVAWTFKDFKTFGNSMPVAVVVDP